MSQRQDDFGRTDHGAPQASPTAPKAEAQEGMSIKGFTGLFANPDQINHRHNLPAHTRLIDLSGPVPEGIFYHPKHEGKPKYTFPTKKVPKEQGSLHFPPEFADDDIPFGMDEPAAETAAPAPHPFRYPCGIPPAWLRRLRGSFPAPNRALKYSPHQARLPPTRRPRPYAVHL